MTKVLSNTIFCQIKFVRFPFRISTRSLFESLWGHETLEKKEAEKIKERKSRLLTWSPLEKPKEDKLKGLARLSSEYTSFLHEREKDNNNKAISKKNIELEAIMSLSKFSSPESDLQSVSRTPYLPSRIEDEASLLSNPHSKPIMEMTMANWTGWIRQPFFSSFTDVPYYVEESRKKNYLELSQIQLFNSRLLTALGPDLAAATFLVSMNCKVRFRGYSEWSYIDAYKVRIGPLFPICSYKSGWALEAIEASRSLIVYEAFQNLRNLLFLKSLDVSYCEMIDEWTLDRIIGEYKESLEYLDISGCIQIDWNGIEALWKCEKLRVLVLYDMDHVKDLPLLCLCLLEVLPNLEIRGVNYIDEKLLGNSLEPQLLSQYDDLLLSQRLLE